MNRLVDSDFSEAEAALISQLGERFQQQAQRLSALEVYKSICEQRIEQLCPNHPIPVREEHLLAHNRQQTEQHHKTEALTSEAGVISHEEAGSDLELISIQSSSQHSSTPSACLPPIPTAELTALQSENESLHRLVSELEAQLALRRRKDSREDGQTGIPLDHKTVGTQELLENARADAASALSQKAHFQSLYNSAKQEAGEKEALECKARGEIQELRKALQVMWDGAATAAKSAQSREEQLASVITSLERRNFSIEMQVLRAKDAYIRAVTEAKALEAEYIQRLKAADDLIESLKQETRTQAKSLEGEVKRLKEAISQQKAACLSLSLSSSC
jgi:hypothetical protein